MRLLTRKAETTKQAPVGSSVVISED